MAYKILEPGEAGGTLRLTGDERYAAKAEEDLLAEAVYGLPELHRDRIRSARLVGNPGCYPTSVNLALYPLAKAGWLAPHIIVDSKSGVSGAGRSAKVATLYCETNESIAAYSVGAHRHQPSVTVLFESVAESYGPNAIGVILTGMGDDGLVGCQAIAEAGGQLLAVLPPSCARSGIFALVDLE